jgi:hypothetical protein
MSSEAAKVPGLGSNDSERRLLALVKEAMTVQLRQLCVLAPVRK